MLDLLEKHNCILYKQSNKYFGMLADNSRVLKYFANLDASAGVLIAYKQAHSACSLISYALFVDSRYTLAALNGIGCNNSFQLHDLSDDAVAQWISSNLPPKASIAYNAMNYKISEIERLKQKLRDCVFCPYENVFPIDETVSKRNADIYFTSERDKNKSIDSKSSKLSQVFSAIDLNGLDAYLLCDPCLVAWIFGIRDLSTNWTPVLLCYLLVNKKRECVIYYDEIYDNASSIFTAIESRQPTCLLKPMSALEQDLTCYEKIGIDKSQTPAILEKNNMLHVESPCVLLKSVKSEKEIADIKAVAKIDSAAIINLLYWISNNSNQCLDELSIRDKLLEIRRENTQFVCESFSCICASDENAAIVHYSPSDVSNKRVNSMALIDSGGQYKNGTTDITRTIAVNPRAILDEIKSAYTLVLKGHLALMDQKFPLGTCCFQLDTLARQFLWNNCEDYQHSTGHGIGCMLNVHEGPCSISSGCKTKLLSGMLLSNEPGYYKEKHFGIRIENMMFVKNYKKNWMMFDTVSLIPFDHNLIDYEMLTLNEKNIIFRYYLKILDAMQDILVSSVSQWLKEYMNIEKYGKL